LADFDLAVTAEALRLFGPARLPQAPRELGGYELHAGSLEATRVLLAVLKLSCGDLARLEHYVRQATLDFRDVLYWAREALTPNLSPTAWARGV